MLACHESIDIWGQVLKFSTNDNTNDVQNRSISSNTPMECTNFKISFHFLSFGEREKIDQKSIFKYFQLLYPSLCFCFVDFHYNFQRNFSFVFKQGKTHLIQLSWCNLYSGQQEAKKCWIFSGKIFFVIIFKQLLFMDVDGACLVLVSFDNDNVEHFLHYSIV